MELLNKEYMISELNRFIADGKLQVTNSGVRFVRNEDIEKLKLHEYITSMRVYKVFDDILSLPTDMRCLHTCEADTELHSSPSVIHDLTDSIIRFIIEYGNQQDSMDGILKIIKCLLEINQEVISECMEEWRNTQLFQLVNMYYLISDNDYTHEEMLEQLIDLEAAKSVRFSDSFVRLLTYICKQTVAFGKFLNEEIQGNEKLKSLKVLAKLSSAAIACVFGMVATYMGDSELLQDMKDTRSSAMWLHMIEGLSRNGGGRFYKKAHQRFFNKNAGLVVMTKTKQEHQFRKLFERELHIRDFYDNAILLQDLKKRMLWFSCMTKENEV
nr:hypothetical protein [Tanacetum cinerariifolium]